MEGIAKGLSSLGPVLLALAQHKKQKEEQLQKIVEEQAKRRLDFEKLDPEMQDLLKHVDPQGVGALYDQTQIAKLAHKKLPANYQPVIPPTRTDTTAEKTDKQLKLAQAAKAETEANAANSNFAVTDLANKNMLDLMKNPGTAAGQYASVTGKLPTTTDELKAFLTTQQQGQNLVAQGVVGSPEWRQNEANTMRKMFVDKYQPSTPKDYQAVLGMADYAARVTDSPPAYVPKSVEADRNAIDQQRIRLGEQELGVSRARIAMEMGNAKLSMAQKLVDNGVDPAKAAQYADTAVESGILPKDVQLPKDQVKALDEQLKGLQVRNEQLKLTNAAIENPQVKLKLDILREKIANRGAGKTYDPAEMQKDINDIYKTAGMPVPKSIPQKSFMDWIAHPFGGPSTSATPPAAHAATPQASSSTTTPPSSSSSTTPISSSVLQQASDQADAWATELQQTKDPQRVQQIKNQRDVMKKAIQSNDEGTLRDLFINPSKYFGSAPSGGGDDNNEDL